MTLSEVISFFRTIPDLNAGGCGIAALAIFRWLKKNEPNTKVSLIMGYLAWSRDLFHNNARLLENLNSEEKPVGASHCWVVADNVAVDSSSFQLETFKPISHEVSEFFMLQAVNNVESWNHLFNRHENVQEIAKKLDIDLSDIELDDPRFSPSF